SRTLPPAPDQTRRGSRQRYRRVSPLRRQSASAAQYVPYSTASQTPAHSSAAPRSLPLIPRSRCCLLYTSRCV
ncbi:hypothetical protein AZZ95_004058, partial [Enterobacter roggenkampii]